ncbi:exported hypothetical protein [Novosphingobium sp. KN65.2]|nr:exported hypothetical protein [Novosphingobium sp. KN65.2]
MSIPIKSMAVACQAVGVNAHGDRVDKLPSSYLTTGNWERTPAQEASCRSDLTIDHYMQYVFLTYAGRVRPEV